MRFRHVCLFLLLGMVGASSGVLGESMARERRFDRLNLGQGLSQSIVEGIAQDRTGFVWMATEDGLNRFDGYTFRIFKNQPGDPDSLVHNELKAVCADRLGGLWVGTFGRGLEYFDPLRETFRHFQNQPGDATSLGGNIIRTIAEDPSGRIWVGTSEGGLNRYEPRTGRFVRYQRGPAGGAGLSSNDVRALAFDSRGMVWIGTQGGGLNRLDPSTGMVTRFPSGAGIPPELGSADIRALAVDPMGRVWIGTTGAGLFCLDPNGGHVWRLRRLAGDPASLPNDSVKALCLDPDGGLWVGTDGGGLAFLNFATNRFTCYRNEGGNGNSLSGNRIYSILVDRSGVLWVGTYGEGLSKTDLRRKRFDHYHHDPDQPASLSSDVVWTFCESRQGVLWVGTNDGGLNRFDPHRGTFTSYRHDPANPRSLSNDSVRSVIEDRNGFLWIATNGGGLDRFDPARGTFRNFRHDDAVPGSLAHNELRAVFEDRSGTIWVGTYGGGLDRFDPVSETFAHYRSNPADRGSLSSDFVRAICEDDFGTLWVGTHGGGLNALDRKSGVFRHYRYDHANPASLSNDFVFSLHADRSGGLWVATYGGGLNRLDRRVGGFSQVRKSDGLADDVVYGILEDDERNLWISTNAGLCRYSTRTGAIRTFTAQDGLQSNEFNGGAFLRCRDGRMLFGGVNGFNMFRPEEIKDNGFLPPIVITDFQLFSRQVPIGPDASGRRILSRSISYTPFLELRYGERIVSFEFAALHFSDPERNRYAYRLEGLGTDWIDLGTRRFLMLTTLPPGDYILQVRGTNCDGVWNPTGVSLAIRVLPPWWRSGWAYGLYLVVGLAVLAGALLFVRRREREKAGVREAELRAEAAELQARYLEAQATAIRTENERKTRELEDARSLQLSMLPAVVPIHPDFEIAACMHTATEVGGDYYDLLLREDGSLAVAIGDATGHGTRAGIMVAAMKLLFSMLAEKVGPAQFLERCHQALKGIHIQQVMMAMTAVHLQKGQAVAAGAAMPPLLVYRAGRGEVESLRLPGMFLGAGIDLPYEESVIPLEPGDALLLMSDGLEELFGPAEELFGEERVRGLFARAALLPAAEGIELLVRAAEDWRGGLPQHDDITLVLVRVRGGGEDGPASREAMSG